MNYYGKFIPNLSSVLNPMYKLLRKDVPFEFYEESIKSFNLVKKLLSTAPVLAHYDTSAPAILTVDASNSGLGCVLSIICKDGVERPVSYSSRSLSPTELQYSQIDKEALAIVYGVKKYHQYLYGRHFSLKSDHKPLLSIFGPKKGLPVFAKTRMQRYALFLSGYNFSIQYVKSENNNADMFSRLPLPVKHTDQSSELGWVGTHLHSIMESSVPITCENIKIETQRDPVLKQVYGFLMYGWPKYVPMENKDLFPFYQRRDVTSLNCTSQLISLLCYFSCLFTCCS